MRGNGVAPPHIRAVSQIDSNEQQQHSSKHNEDDTDDDVDDDNRQLNLFAQSFKILFI